VKGGGGVCGGVRVEMMGLIVPRTDRDPPTFSARRWNPSNAPRPEWLARSRQLAGPGRRGDVYGAQRHTARQKQRTAVVIVVRVALPPVLETDRDGMPSLPSRDARCPSRANS
jgi:hypothetical protein